MFQEPFGARPFALGHAYTALGDDVFGMAYNPAIIGRLTDTQTAAQLSRSFLAARLGYFAAASPLSPSQALGFGLGYLDAGRAEIFDDNGSSLGRRDVQKDLLLAIDYARSFSRPPGRLYLGASGKYLHSSILDELRGTALAADAGILYERPLGRGMLSAAAALCNIGPPFRYSGGLAAGLESDPLPLTSRLAVGYGRTVFVSDRMSFGAEFDRVFYDEDIYQGFGFEYAYRRLASLRLGWRVGEDLLGLRLGMGLTLGGLSVDYAIGLVSGFENVQRLSLAYRFKVPGIRYAGPPLPPSPLEVLVERANASLSSWSYFEAAQEWRRIEEFFPSAPDALRLKYRIQEEINAILSEGPANARYPYAYAFQQFEEGRWEEAVRAIEALLRFDPLNEEAGKYLGKARKRLEAQKRQERLQRQARTAALFALASEAYESGNQPRALRILEEILRVEPYRPAERLKEKIEADARSRPPARPQASPPTAPSPLRPGTSPEDAARAERLFYEGVRDYADNRVEDALRNLREALRLDPDNSSVRAALAHIEKALGKTGR